jgi:DNA-binding transcriptional MerR regulator
VARAKPARLVKMAELAELSGVPGPTIKHYLREGLLSTARRTSRNMAYYDARLADRVRVIKELQAERFLPLRVIGELLEPSRRSQLVMSDRSATDRRVSTPDRVNASVRRASGSDVPAITRLINRAYQVEAFFVDGDRISEGEVAALAAAEQLVVLDGATGGLAAAIHIDPTGERGYFGLLSVDPAFQGLGLGKRMIAVAEALCEAMGCRRMSLRVVNVREELPPFYRRLGYRETGATSPFDDPRVKRPCHFVEMEKALA